MSEKSGAMVQRRDRQPEGAGANPAVVQAHACVLAVDEDWSIRAVSENSQDLLGLAPKALIGKSLTAILAEDIAHGMRARAQVLTSADPVARMEACALLDTGRLRDVTATRLGTGYCLEVELPARGPGMSADPEQIRRLARLAAAHDNVADAAQEAARTLAAMTGFARVSVHRIGRSGLGPALGVAGTRPLADAPDRLALAAHSEAFGAHIHVIPDVSATETCSFVTAGGAAPPTRAEVRGLGSAGFSDDLGYALHRAGVRAAMTIPLRVAGDLWGAILCHNDMPVRPGVGDRGALSLFSHLLGYEIGRMEHLRVDEARRAALDLHGTMVAELDRRPDLAAAVRSTAAQIADLIPNDGWLLWQQGRFESSGAAVTQSEFETIFAELHRMDLRRMRCFDRLDEITRTVRRLDPQETAMMVIPISAAETEYLLLFRRVSAGDDRIRVWESWERAAGDALRTTLLEAKLQVIERTHDTGKRRRDRQELMVGELNHRTRNILNLIQGLVGQGAGEATTIEGYAQVLEARIHAIARAHDDLIEHDWGRVGLHVLLERELSDALAAKSGHGPVARISGRRIDLSPTAFTTMALVLHELARNAREHGALARPSGLVQVDMSPGEDGCARLVWREFGGAVARRPKRRGFGLKVIEEAVPHELRGKAEVDFGPDGLVAKFSLPPGHFTQLRPEPEPTGIPTREQAARPDEITIDGAALILDDSLIIAIESEELLRAAGASDVYACNSVESALAALDKGDVTFALLDVNLGSETSLPVAEQLWIDGIPAVLATGYGSNEDLLNDFPPLPVLSKPYTVGEIKEVLRHFSRRERS